MISSRTELDVRTQLQDGVVHHFQGLISDNLDKQEGPLSRLAAGSHYPHAYYTHST